MLIGLGERRREAFRRLHKASLAPREISTAHRTPWYRECLHRRIRQRRQPLAQQCTTWDSS